jgi:DNA repair protein RecN (Recombination protein N)
LFLKHNVSDLNELIEIRNELAGDQKGASELEAQIIETEESITEKKNLFRSWLKNFQKQKKNIPVFIKKAEGLLKKLGLKKPE